MSHTMRLAKSVPTGTPRRTRPQRSHRCSRWGTTRPSAADAGCRRAARERRQPPVGLQRLRDVSSHLIGCRGQRMLADGDERELCGVLTVRRNSRSIRTRSPRPSPRRRRPTSPLGRCITFSWDCSGVMDESCWQEHADLCRNMRSRGARRRPTDAHAGSSVSRVASPVHLSAARTWIDAHCWGSVGRGFSGDPSSGGLRARSAVDDGADEAGIGLELQAVPIGSGPAVVAVRVSDDRRRGDSVSSCWTRMPFMPSFDSSVSATPLVTSSGVPESGWFRIAVSMNCAPLRLQRSSRSIRTRSLGQPSSPTTDVIAAKVSSTS